jgi:hypothetical protein
MQDAHDTEIAIVQFADENIVMFISAEKGLPRHIGRHRQTSEEVSARLGGFCKDAQGAMFQTLIRCQSTGWRQRAAKIAFSSNGITFASSIDFENAPASKRIYSDCKFCGVMQMMPKFALSSSPAID